LKSFIYTNMYPYTFTRLCIVSLSLSCFISRRIRTKCALWYKYSVVI